MMNRIGIDLRNLAFSHMTGVQRLTYNLTVELIKSSTEEYFTVGTFRDEKLLPAKRINIDLPNVDGIYWDKLISLAGHAYGLELLFSPYYPIPEKRSFKGVLLICDLIALRHPEWFGNPQHILALFKRIGESARHCDQIIAISEATRRDIVELFSISAEKVRVIPLAPADYFRQSREVHNREQTCGLLLKYGISMPYLLSNCTLEPRKNLPRLLSAYELLRDRIKERFGIVLAGAQGWNNDELRNIIKYSKYQEDIIIPGYVPDEDLLSMYQNCMLFVYPSLYEGFGLPVLEAMCCGAPVVTSNRSSLPEVAGDCAAYCDPYQVESIAVAIAQVLLDPAKAQMLSRRGLERSKQFTWAETARQTREVFLSCL